MVEENSWNNKNSINHKENIKGIKDNARINVNEKNKRINLKVDTWISWEKIRNLNNEPKNYLIEKKKIFS